MKFSPPVEPRGDSADVKYAIERGFLPTVAGPYVGAYMGDLAGLKAYKDGKAEEISRHHDAGRPDDRLQARPAARRDRRRRAGAAGLGAGAEGVRAEVRQAKQPSTYGNYQVATGPYMIENDASGKLTGYTPGTRSSSSATRTGTRRPTTSRRTWTRSRSRRATTPTSPRRQILEG